MLFLHLQAARERLFDLVLLDAWGTRLGCVCGERGNHELHKGRFFVAVRSPAGATGDYRLLRASRTITKTALRVEGAGRATAAPGDAAELTVTTTPAVSGPVTVDLEQFDPLEGWQFVRALRERAVDGTAKLRFAAPHRRPLARPRHVRGNPLDRTERDTRGFVTLLVATPLRD